MIIIKMIYIINTLVKSEWNWSFTLLLKSILHFSQLLLLMHFWEKDKSIELKMLFRKSFRRSEKLKRIKRKKQNTKNPISFWWKDSMELYTSAKATNINNMIDKFEMLDWDASEAINNLAEWMPSQKTIKCNDEKLIQDFIQTWLIKIDDEMIVDDLEEL